MKKLTLPLKPLHKLVRWGNRIRAYYGHAVYLVGSQVRDKPNPGDTDVVCIIPDNEFELRFGMKIGDWHQEQGTGLFSENYWEWTERCVKDSLDGMRFTGLKIDFKVYSETYALAFPEARFPRLRLDTRDTPSDLEHV